MKIVCAGLAWLTAICAPLFAPWEASYMEVLTWNSSTVSAAEDRQALPDGVIDRRVGLNLAAGFELLVRY